MKKFLALILSLSTLFLCSCSGKSNNENESTATQTQSTTKHASSFTEWGTDRLPDDFPAPPESAHSLSVSSGSASSEGTGYRSDWTRLKFTCIEKDILLFSSALNQNGYTGKAKYLSSTSYFPNGYNGNWQNGKTLVRINSCKLNDSGEFVVELDVLDCVDNFPTALTEYFPKFDGYSRNAGIYCGYNGIDDVVSEKFNGNLNVGEHWYWDFGFENAFVGVTTDDFDNYIDKLVEAEFSGKMSDSTVDTCSVTSADLVKEVGDAVYGCFLLYNRSLQTLDIVYTNHIERYVGNIS